MQKTEHWEPCEARVSRTVLRAAARCNPAAYSPEVSPVRLRERALAVRDRAAPGISPAQGRDKITDGSGMSTGNDALT